MKIIEKVLMNKLISLGYDAGAIEPKLREIDYDLIDRQIAFEDEANSYIKLIDIKSPTTDVARMIINNNKKYIATTIIDGNVTLGNFQTSIGYTMPVADYPLDQNLCIISTTTNLTVEILRYVPTTEVKAKFAGFTYEKRFSADRNTIATEYNEAFLENGKAPKEKVKDILSLLLLEYIIDDLAITDENPRIKLYDNPDAYADNITEYRIKYINRKNNKIELAYRPVYIKRLGAGVTAGLISNDPYIKLSDLSEPANFSLNTVTCYWVTPNNSKREEIAIYIASKNYGEFSNYHEYKFGTAKKNVEFVNSLLLQFQREADGLLDRNYIENVLQKLNFELLYPPMDIIRECMQNPADPVDPIRYKFKAFSVPSDFEEKLYISIEDNIGKRYKYKLTENIMDDFTRIGNKLEYTNDNGEIIQKQSIADFNTNMPTAIIRRETLIDSSKIPGLLGYIYEDLEYMGTEMLPVPNIEVDFFFPKKPSTNVSMYNGTVYDGNTEMDTGIKFNSSSTEQATTKPGTAYAIVRYINSRGEILKENKIINLLPGTTYTPEILPIINDVNGGEWIFAETQYPSMVVNNNSELNVVELKYSEKKSKVTITFLSRDGKKICDDIIETVQSGTIYNIDKLLSFTDEKQNEWKLVTARPQKLLVKDEKFNNTLILVYDIDKENVTTRFVNGLGQEVIPARITEVPIGKEMNIVADRIIIDSKGLGWIYEGKNPISHVPSKNSKNVIEIRYEEYKLPVTVKYQSEEGVDLLEDKVEYLQVGKSFVATADDKISDISCRRWQLKDGGRKEIIVSKEEKENIIYIKYEPAVANITIYFVNEQGKNIMNSVKKVSQIGEVFKVETVNVVTDNYGKLWEIAKQPESTTISQNDFENIISLVYKPLISHIVVNYYDDERNEIIPGKEYDRQAGTLFKPEIIDSLQSKDGRVWIVDKEKIQEHLIKKNDEENFISIFYTPKFTELSLRFTDMFGKELKKPEKAKAQIGSIYDAKGYGKIKDDEGGGWMLDSSEPKKMVVKASDNKFTLMYGEIKAIIVVKHVDVKTNSSIIDDIVLKEKIGKIFVPNIEQKILDKNKYQWRFVGNNSQNRTVKENEQENIVILQYEEALSKVKVEYINDKNEKIRDDIIYEWQIGKALDFKATEKQLDSTGLGWKFAGSKSNNNVTTEGDNFITNHYTPWIEEVTIKYVNDKDIEIAQPSITKMQVGSEFIPSVENKLQDDSDLVWKYDSISEEKIRVQENGNLVVARYIPATSNVSEMYISKTGELIYESVFEGIQIGSKYDAGLEKEYIDAKGAEWVFVKIDKSSIIVKEDNSQNIINKFFTPKVSKLTIKAYNNLNQEIMQPIVDEAQVGSEYKPNMPEIYIDSKTKLGWIILNSKENKIVVKEDSSNNLIQIKYDKYLAKVIENYVNESGNKIRESTESLAQVGSTYNSKMIEEIKDQEGREWIFDKKQESKTIQNVKPNKQETDEISNIIINRYKPSLVNVVVKYQDTLGNAICPNEEFKAQIGSKYTPPIKENIVDKLKNKWTYNPNSKSSIIVSKNVSENIITLAYEEEKAPIIYKYQDEYGNRLRTPKKKLEQIGKTCTPEIDGIIEDEQGRAWEFKSANLDKIEVKDSAQDNVVELTYIPLLIDVLIIQKNIKGEKINEVIEKAQLGSIYKPSLNEDLFDENSLMFKLNKNSVSEIKIKEVPIGLEENPNKIEAIYGPVYSTVSIVYQDVDGNKLKDDEVIQFQVGTKYTPKQVQFVNDKKGIQWENISKDVDSIRVKENPKDNIIKMSFEIAKAEVMVKFKDIDGNIIKESMTFQETVGREFVPQVDNVILDGKNRKWTFNYAEPVKLTVGSINNIISLVYTESKVPVTIKFQTKDGRKLREDVVEKIQEGERYTPKKNFATIYDENDIWKYLEFRPASLLVTSNIAENVIIQVYDNKGADDKSNILVNPFANTLTEEEKELQKQIDEKKARKAMEQAAKPIWSEINAEATLDLSNAHPIEETPKGQSEVESKVSEEASTKAEKTNNMANTTGEINFTEDNLIELTRSVLLDNNEKSAIKKLNDVNKNIMLALKSYEENFSFEIADDVVRKIDELMEEEKNIITSELGSLIAVDKSGKKFLKILEAIVRDDSAYRKLQERKVILLTDYFVSSSNTNFEQANYICERGKNDKELLILQAKIVDMKNKYPEWKKEYINLLYEKAMLDNYYQARTEAKDEYFTSETAKDSLPSEIIILVTNTLPKQAYQLLSKENLTFTMENELDAIINLLTAQQKGTLQKMISEIKDGRQRKAMQKRLNNIT